MSESYVKDGRGPYFTQVFHYEVDTHFQRIEKKRRAHAIAVYVVVARHAGRDATAFPSLSTIMELTGLARATVVDSLKALKAAGLIKATKRTNRRGQASNLYELVSSAGEPVSSGDELAVSSGDELEEDTVSKKNSRRDADASADVMRDPGRYFANLLKTVDKEPTDRERERCFVHLKQLVDKQGATREEMEKVVAKGFEAHMTGNEWWPKDLLHKIRNGNVLPFRREPEEPQRPQKRVIS